MQKYRDSIRYVTVVDDRWGLDPPPLTVVVHC